MKRVCVLLLSLWVVAGCGPKVPPEVRVSHVANAAVYGRQFVIAGNGALTGIDSVMSTGMLPREYGLPILHIMKTVGDSAVVLADILLLIDAAATVEDRDSAVLRARSIIDGMLRLLDNAAVPIPDTKIKSVVTASLSTLSAILREFGATLSAMIGRLSAVAADLHTIPLQWATSPLLYPAR